MTNEQPPTARDAKARAKSEKAYKKASRPWFKKKRFWLLGILVLIIAISVATQGGGDDKADDPSPSVAATTEAPAAEETEAPAATEPPAIEEPAAPELPMGQQNATASANNYLDIGGFSRSGLIGQLEFEGYSTEDATAAVDSIAPDWNAQATKKAQQYLDTSAFSRDGLIEQLEFEGFTPEEAASGAAAVGY